MKDLQIKTNLMLQKFKTKCDTKGERNALRQLWAINGILEKKLLVNTVRRMVLFFTEKDIVPTHYYYPELYKL